MPDPSESSGSKEPRQLTLPECTLQKTRRRSGLPLRRVNSKRSLTIPNMPADVTTILKAQAKRSNMTYSAYCRQALILHVQQVLSPRARR